MAVCRGLGFQPGDLKIPLSFSRNSVAVALPMPLPAPVTIIVFCMALPLLKLTDQGLV